MAGLEIKRFDSPDETRPFADKGEARVVNFDYALFETPYRPEHVKTKTLRPMEREGKLEAVNPPAGRKRGFYPDEIELRFKP